MIPTYPYVSNTQKMIKTEQTTANVNVTDSVKKSVRIRKPKVSKSVETLSDIEKGFENMGVVEDHIESIK